MTRRQRREVVGAGRQADDVADVVEPVAEAAFEAADQRVRVAAPDGERADHGGVGARQRPGERPA